MIWRRKVGKQETELPEQPFTVHLDGDTITAEITELSSAYLARGYGEKDEHTGKIVLHPCEALYLLERQKIEVTDKNKDTVNFNQLLSIDRSNSPNIWTDYVVFRDLRKRGYVVKEGFGPDFRFRVFERGSYETDTAKFLVVPVVEGKNVGAESLKHLLAVSRALKKKVILSVVDRRNEIVYYLSALVELINV